MDTDTRPLSGARRKAVKKLFLCLLSVAIAGAPLTAITKDAVVKSEVLPQEVYKQAVPGLSAKDKLRFNKGE